jgi:hypothetical protein
MPLLPILMIGSNARGWSSASVVASISMLRGCGLTPPSSAAREAESNQPPASFSARAAWPSALSPCTRRTPLGGATRYSAVPSRAAGPFSSSAARCRATRAPGLDQHGRGQLADGSHPSLLMCKRPAATGRFATSSGFLQVLNLHAHFRAGESPCSGKSFRATEKPSARAA